MKKLLTVLLVFSLLVTSASAALGEGDKVINIGVTSGLLPNTGVVLPFFSAGLTSLWCVFIALGLVMNVALQQRDPDAV